MDKFKRFITPVTVALMALCMPLLVHASDNSVTIIPAEGNGNCNDYAANSTILSMAPDGVGTLSGPDGESGTYTLTTDLKTLSFNTTIPMDYAVLKSKRTISVLFYQSGGIDNDSNMTIPGDLEITGFEMCYGLSNDAVPVNQAPVLNPIGDKEVTNGNDLSFSVTATDDALPSDTLTISHSTLPAGASFSDDGYGTGYFEWVSATPAGSTNVTFTVSDGALIDTETITITVNAIPPEPVVTPICGTDTDKLDEIGISCPTPVYTTDEFGNQIITNSSVVCNMELNEDYYGTADSSDVCCICNAGELEECDPGTPAGEISADGKKSCNLTAAEKALRNLPAAEVTTIIEFNNDPYYCYTYGGRRICFLY